MRVAGTGGWVAQAAQHLSPRPCNLQPRLNNVAVHISMND